MNGYLKGLQTAWNRMRVFKGGVYPTTIFLGAYSDDFRSRYFLEQGFFVCGMMGRFK